MALLHSEWALGRKPVARPQTAHNTHSQLFVIDVPAGGIKSGDILELAVLPPYAQIIDAAVVGVLITDAGATVDVGIMSGDVGEALDASGNARTSADEIFDGAALTGIVRLSAPGALLIPATEKARSIGLKFNAAIVAGTGKKVGLMLHFAQ